MNVLHIFILSILQGITEFLPISSSAHLILFPKLMNWNDQGLAFDISVHVGTLLAIIWYFRKEIKLMIFDWFRSVFYRNHTINSNFAWMVIFGTIPVGIVGFLCKSIVENWFRDELIIAITAIVFGLLMGIAYYYSKRNRNEYSITWKDVLIIGLSQVISLVPGSSRSGLTTTAGLFVGLTPKAASRYSFLLAIPVIAAAGLLQSVELIRSNIVVPWNELFLAVIFSALSGYISIYFFLKLINRIGLYPFVIYRIILGIFLFTII